MAEFDVPAMLEFIISNTGFDSLLSSISIWCCRLLIPIPLLKNGDGRYKTLTYVGHSEGTTIMFAALSTNTSLANYLNAFVGFGPVVTVGNIANPFLRVCLLLKPKNRALSHLSSLISRVFPLRN